eukprot:TRINITY_DN39572_c0_g1_i1.p1 TRINITY_DN39572_c0_g1~~TRINITY_DN39572_c0_g1_i1.p1  ORF type:complete len:125 (-),score=21.08 TRINITY_DN39572_c0_g1_i1:91-465(-)
MVLLKKLAQKRAEPDIRIKEIVSSMADIFARVDHWEQATDGCSEMAEYNVRMTSLEGLSTNFGQRRRRRSTTASAWSTPKSTICVEELSSRVDEFVHTYTMSWHVAAAKSIDDKRDDSARTRSC